MGDITTSKIVDLTSDQSSRNATVGTSDWRQSSFSQPRSNLPTINKTSNAAPAHSRQTIDLTKDKSSVTPRRSIQQRYGTIPASVPANPAVSSVEQDLPPLDEVLRALGSETKFDATTMHEDVFDIGSRSVNQGPTKASTARDTSYLTRKGSESMTRPSLTLGEADATMGDNDDFRVRHDDFAHHPGRESVQQENGSEQLQAKSAGLGKTVTNQPTQGLTRDSKTGYGASMLESRNANTLPQRVRDLHSNARSNESNAKKSPHTVQKKHFCARCNRADPKCSNSRKYCDLCIQDNWSMEARSRVGSSLSNSELPILLCAICSKPFNHTLALKGHFNNCKHKTGNPNNLRWDSHSSVKRYLQDQEAALSACQVDSGSVNTLSPATQKASESDHPIDIFANKKNDFSKKRGRDVEQLASGRKILLGDLPVDTLFYPKQIASRKEIERASEAKRRKRVRSDLEPTMMEDHSPTSNDETFDRDGLTTQNSPEPPIPSHVDIASSHQDLGEDAEPSPRPTISGKGISAATLAAWDNQAKEVEAEKETPQLVYVYFFDLKAWTGQNSAKNIYAKNFGPYHTLAEANMTASTEVKFPLEHLEGLADHDGGLEEPRGGWSYEYKEDENGLQTHKMLAGNIQAEAVVRREIPPPPNRIALPPSAFTTPPTVFLAQRLVRFSLPQPDDLFGEIDPEHSNPPDCEHTTLGVCTVPDLAFKRAAKAYVDFRARGMSAIEKNEIKMEMRNELKELEADGFRDMLKKTVHFEEDTEEGFGGRKGTFAVWVEKVEVKGPRN